MSGRLQPWGAVKLGPVANVLLILSLPIIFIVATTLSVVSMLIKSKVK